MGPPFTHEEWESGDKCSPTLPIYLVTVPEYTVVNFPRRSKGIRQQLPIGMFDLKAHVLY